MRKKSSKSKKAISYAVAVSIAKCQKLGNVHKEMCFLTVSPRLEIQSSAYQHGQGHVWVLFLLAKGYLLAKYSLDTFFLSL